MPAVSTQDVITMYSRYPYPSPVVGGGLAYDIANLFSLLCPGDALEGRSVLDAGCGTAQRAVGFAQRYPGARVQGIDAVDASLHVARELASRHGVRNASFSHGDIMQLEMGETFDFIISTGVVHHLEDPRRGLHNLCRHLSPDGVICIWLYHPFGELDRLLGRELLLTLWGDDRADLALGQRLMEQLDLRLGAGRYGQGVNAAQAESRRGRLSADADAYMHPIVHAYRFGEAMSMFRESGMAWVAVNGLNTVDDMKLMDLGGVEEEGRDFCLRTEDLFPAGELRGRFETLPRMERLRIAELMTRPTGFTLVAGRGDSLGRLSPRVAGNAVTTGDLPEPDPRIFRV
ncbi:class I SAM-dependent methyltransferase [Longimicrobium sp.]|uniref:class I SAM-dependent methyltransferase n=1 Tax=Longimicrobium sp. TaxID=2029185 RepID=UPI003B3BA132